MLPSTLSPGRLIRQYEQRHGNYWKASLFPAKDVPGMTIYIYQSSLLICNSKQILSTSGCSTLSYIFLCSICGKCAAGKRYKLKDFLHWTKKTQKNIWNRYTFSHILPKCAYINCIVAPSIFVRTFAFIYLTITFALWRNNR